MKKCGICNKGIMIPTKRYKDGFICGKCAGYISDFIITDGKTLDECKRIVEYNKNIDFEETASLGTLHLDSFNHTFAVSNGKNTNNVFDINDLKALGIYVYKPHQVKNNIYGDIAFEFKLVNKVLGEIKRREIILKNQRLDYKIINGNEVQIEPPSILRIFENMFLESVNNCLNRTVKKLEMANDMLSELNQEPVNGNELEYARGILYLNEEYTQEELKHNRNALLKLLHSDAGGKDEFAEKINSAYKILKR